MTIGGVGLVAAAGGLGLWAWRSYRSQFPTHCTESMSGGRPLCDTSGVQAVDRARLTGDAATVVVAVGGVAIVTGALLLWRFPGKEHGVTVMPTTKGAGLAIQGAF